MKHPTRATAAVAGLLFFLATACSAPDEAAVVTTVALSPEEAVANEFSTCIANGMDANPDLLAMSTAGQSITRASNPEQLNRYAKFTSECLGPEGVAATLVSEIKVNGVSLPPEMAACLTPFAEASGAALMRASFAVERSEVQEPATAGAFVESMSYCYPGASYLATIIPVEPTPDEQQCLNVVYQNDEILRTYFSAVADVVQAFSDDDTSKLMSPAYRCLNVPQLIFANQGGVDGFSDEARICMNREAKNARFLEGGVGEANQTAFGDRLVACMTDADRKLFDSRS